MIWVPACLRDLLGKSWQLVWKPTYIMTKSRLDVCEQQCFPGRLILAADALSRNLHGKVLQEWWLAEPDRAARGGWWCQREATVGFLPPHQLSVINTPSLNCSWHIPVWGRWWRHPEWDSARWQMQPLWLTLVLPSLSLAEWWSY